MAHALISPTMIQWAIRRSGLTVSEISKRLEINIEKLHSIEHGDEPIAFGKAKTLAKIANIPFGFLFLSEPPKETPLLLPDLRTINSQEVDEPSHALQEIIRINQERVDWYRDYLIKQGFESNEYVGKLAEAKVNQMVEFLQRNLQVTRRGNAKDYYRDLVKAVEDLRIMVVQDSDLGHHSKPLNSEEFRGFAIADSVAPLIFINTADSLNAQLFTLIHELVHILKGESGISDNDMSTVHPTEVFCNAVAGEFLVAESEFIKQWQSISKNEPIEIIFEKLAKEFYVSRHVIARRAMTLKYISQSEYQDYIARLHEEYLASKGKRFKGGPSYYVVKNSKLSTQLSQAVVSETLAGKMLYRDGGHLLGMKPSNIKSFAKETGMRI